MKSLVVICVMLLSSIVYAQNINIKVHSSDSVATGYTDIAVDGPANKALDREGNGFTALSIDVHGTLSEGLSAFSWVQDVIDFKESLDLSNILKSYNDLTSLVARSNWDLGTTARVDLMKFSIVGKKLGFLSIGSYVESSAGIIVRAPKKEDIKINETWLDIGRDLNVIAGQGSVDGGLELGYGRMISLPYKLKLGVGIQNRVFYRFSVPKHVVRFNKEIHGEDDISIPDFTYNKGWGFGTDLFTSLDLNDRYLNTRISVEVRNIGLVWYDDFSERDIVQFGIGMAISPFSLLNIEEFKVLADLEVYENGITSIQTGAQWRLGNQRFHFTPCVGGVLIGRDVWGNSYRSFTAGFSAKIAVLELVGAFEYFGSDRYDVGTRVAISW